MITCKCIKKFRNKSGNIYGYRLVDLNGQMQDVKPENLKQAIKNKQITVVNLKLTADNRLVDSNEAQLQNKNILGEEPEIEKSYSDKEYDWLLKIATVVFKGMNCGKPTYCGDCDELNEFESDKLQDIKGNSLALSLLDCCVAEYIADYNGKLTDFVSKWGLVYIIYGNLKTKVVSLYLGSRTFEINKFKVEMKISSEKDVMRLITEGRELYKQYLKEDKQYKAQFAKAKMSEIDKIKKQRLNRESSEKSNMSKLESMFQ